MKIRLGNIAYARSGDKGSSANIGVIAINEQAYRVIQQHLTPKAVELFFSLLPRQTPRRFVRNVVRYELPNLGALNFILPEILDGGGSVSLKTDAQGKALGQQLLELELEIPDAEIPR